MRLISVGIAAIFSAQCLFAYQPEKNFWAQRRSAVRAARPVVLASGGDFVSSLSAQFPFVPPVRPSLSPSLTRSLPIGFLRDQGTLLSALSPVYGTVRKVIPGNPGGHGRLVIHIQDVHHNAEAQANIRGAVSDLLKSGRVAVVGLEGATEDIDLQAFVDFPHRQAVEMAADYLLKENKISGPIHAALTSSGRLPRLLGIDDPLHYEANVRAVRDSAARADEVRRSIRSQQAEINTKKAAVFSPALLVLDRVVSDYRAERVSLETYVEALVSTPGGTGTFPAVDSFLNALKLERTLDFKQVETERGRLIEKLTQTLTAQEIESLMAESVAYRSGERRFGDFYAGLQDLCRRKGIALAAFPAMDAYIRYVLMADGIDPELLLKENIALEKAAFDRVVRTAEERVLAAQSREIWLAGRLAEFVLTPAEWEEWAAHKRNCGLDLSSFESFYREAQSRDNSMADNLWGSLGPGSVAVLVTGGFHAEGVARRLEQRGVTVVSYVPKIEKVDTAQGAAYLSVFSQEKTPLEKLFSGQKLFLSTNPLAPADRKIRLPIAVTLAALWVAGSLDPQTVYQILGGIGTVGELVKNTGFVQAAVSLGAGAMVFQSIVSNKKMDLRSFPRKPDPISEWKIKVWDPLREQAKYYLPAVIVGPYVLSLGLTTLFDGGLGLLIVFYTLLGGVGQRIMVPVFLANEHPRFTRGLRRALTPVAEWVSVLTRVVFILAYALLSPLGVGLIVAFEPFFPLIPTGEVKAFIFAAFFGFVAGLWKHMAHNERSYGNYLKWVAGDFFTGLLPLSAQRRAGAKPIHEQLPEILSIETPLGEDSEMEEEFGRFQITVGGDRFIVSHKRASPLFHYQWGFSDLPMERLTVESLTRNGKEVNLPIGPYGILEFVTHRDAGAITKINAEMRHGIPHPRGEAPYNAGSVLMAVLLKKIAGPPCPRSR
ncbi:MAG: hypothetical protein IPN90_04620 [Elusimicrobia bacterium]|nr:hypothetical protein [Elusimicrobiota bacterium]